MESGKRSPSSGCSLQLNGKGVAASLVLRNPLSLMKSLVNFFCDKTIPLGYNSPPGLRNNEVGQDLLCQDTCRGVV